MRRKVPARDQRLEDAVRGATPIDMVSVQPVRRSGKAKKISRPLRERSPVMMPTHLGPNVARDLAHAEFRLAKVRHIKAALIDRAWTFGSLDSALDPPLLTARAITNFGPILEATGRFLKPPDVEASMPSTEPERTAEAVVRTLRSC